MAIMESQSRNEIDCLILFLSGENIIIKIWRNKYYQKIGWPRIEKKDTKQS